MSDKTIIKDLRILIDEKSFFSDANRPCVPDVLLLDQFAITERLNRLSETDPYFARRDVEEFVEKVSRRVADRLARLFCTSWRAPVDMISEAIYFALFAQLCTIIPLR